MRALLLFTLLSFLGLTTEAQVHEVKKFSFAPKQPTWTWSDLSGYFEQESLALTSAGDFLVFSTRHNGTWELYRVRGWNTEKPVTDHVEMTGYFSSHDQHDLENVNVKVYMAPNNAYAVCVGTAEWLKRVGGKAVGKARTTSIIKVIDLSTFKVVNSTQTSATEPYEFQSVEMDGEGRIMVISNAFGAKQHGEFIQLNVPSLSASPKCSYDFTDTQHMDHPVPDTVETCEQDLGPLTLEDYFKRASPNPPRSPGFTCKDATAEYCPEPESFTVDGLFGLGVRTEGHDNILGSWVQTRATAILFSKSSHAEIGELDLTHQQAQLKLAPADGKDYLLSLLSGSELTVYELIDPAARKMP